jgi:hypothetical protein
VGLLNEWSNVVTAAAAVVALAVSFVSLALSWRSFHQLERQERRKEPKLVCKLLDSRFDRSVDGGRAYSFSISVLNPTDSDNAIAQIELRLRYSIDRTTIIAAKIPLDDKGNLPDGAAIRLRTPCRVSAHDTESGWCAFLVDPAVLQGRTVEGHQLVLMDSHQVEATLDMHLISQGRHVT